MPIDFGPSYWEKTWSHRKAGAKGIKGAILAAGLGRRMEPLSSCHLPKPMFPLGGKVPMAEVWLRRMVESGINDVSMNLCVLGETIKQHFQDGAKFGASINYVTEGIPSGTLGGVCKLALGRHARKLSREEPITVKPFQGSTVIAPSGDIVTNFGAKLLEEMYAIHKRVGAAFTMVLVPVPWQRRKDFGTVVLRRPAKLKGSISKSGAVQDFLEKDPNAPSNLCNASIYMIEMDLLKELDGLRTEANRDIPNAFYDFGQHVFPALIGRPSSAVSLGRTFPLWAIQYDGGWFDVGQKRDYLSVNQHVLDKKLNIPLPYENLPWGYIGTNVSIDFSKVTIIPPVIIGNDCVVESNSRLGPYAVIGDSWVIEKRVHIRNSVLWSPFRQDQLDRADASKPDSVVDVRRIQRGGIVEKSIVVAGDVQGHMKEKTVDLYKGKLRILSIDYVPPGPRA